MASIDNIMEYDLFIIHLEKNIQTLHTKGPRTAKKKISKNWRSPWQRISGGMWRAADQGKKTAPVVVILCWNRWTMLRMLAWAWNSFILIDQLCLYRNLRPRHSLWYCRDETDLMPQSRGSDLCLNPLCDLSWKVNLGVGEISAPTSRHKVCAKEHGVIDSLQSVILV